MARASGVGIARLLCGGGNAGVGVAMTIAQESLADIVRAWIYNHQNQWFRNADVNQALGMSNSSVVSDVLRYMRIDGITVEVRGSGRSKEYRVSNLKSPTRNKNPRTQRIKNAVLAQTGWFSAAGLAEALGVYVGSVWGAIHSLRRGGVNIVEKGDQIFVLHGETISPQTVRGNPLFFKSIIPIMIDNLARLGDSPQTTILEQALRLMDDESRQTLALHIWGCILDKDHWEIIDLLTGLRRSLSNVRCCDPHFQIALSALKLLTLDEMRDSLRGLLSEI